jgi:hypothetical protein
MIIARNRVFGAILAALLVVICFCVPRERSYAGKPVSLWCDYLPFTDQLPAALGGKFARMYRSSTNQAEQARFRDLETQALLAINTLGTNCLPELLSRLRKERSPIQFESRKLAAKLGFIKRTEVDNWHTRRTSALTGILELADRAKTIAPELTALKGDADPWLSAAASYALKQIALSETGRFPNEETVQK